LTLEQLSLEFNDFQKNHNHFQTGGQNLEIWPLAAKPGNEKFVKGSPYENNQFLAAGPNLEIWQ